MSYRPTKYEYIEYLLSLDVSAKIELIKMLSNELELKPISQVAKEKGKSYNGIKNFDNVIKIGNKNFVIKKPQPIKEGANF